MNDRTIETRRDQPSPKRRWRPALNCCAVAVLALIMADVHAAPINTGSVNPLSPAEAAERLRALADREPSGFYAVEAGFSFNSLDAISYDVTSGRIALVGHVDPRFSGPRIPYLQHLATLLESPNGQIEPRFSLNTEPASRRNMQAKVAGTSFSQRSVLSHFAETFDQQGAVTPLGRAILSSLGLSPIQGHRPPGFLGVEVEALASGNVRVKSLLAGSPAADAGLMAGDEIARFNGKASSSAGEFERLVRFAGSQNKVAVSYIHNGRPAEASIVLATDSDRDPWKRATQADVAGLLPATIQGPSTVERLMEFARSNPAGFQVPPEIVEKIVGARHESVPEYIGVSSTSQLARLMFEVDYAAIKPLPHRVDLKQRLPGYQTLFDWSATHPQMRQAMAGYRIWISVAKMDVAQSSNGTTLAIRDTAMRINFVRESADGRDAAKADQSPAQGYANVLTPLYDEFARDYFELHELREVAKLAAAASWIRAKSPNFRLPVEGRVAWSGPSKVPGMTYLQTARSGSDDIWLVPHGGVNLTPFPPGAPKVIPTDGRAPELAGNCPGGQPQQASRCVSNVAAAPAASPPQQYKPSGNALIGGVRWLVGYNDQTMSPEAVAKARAMLKKQMELAGIPYNEAIDFRRYNFVLGIARSTNVLIDVGGRAFWDNLSLGDFSAEQRELYASLRGRSFNELACHSNGAMICLTALARKDVIAKHVVLYGPQITPESLQKWDELVRSGKIGSIELRINQGDPIPSVTLISSNSTLPITLASGGLAALPVFNSTVLSKVITTIAPSINVKTFACSGLPTLDCHDMHLYKINRGNCPGSSGLIVPGTARPGRPGVFEPPPPC